MIIDFAGLYERYAQDVYRFALYLCGDPVYAQDIAAEPFVRAWVTPGEIRVGTVKAYLFMIARNLFWAGLRQDKRQSDLDRIVLAASWDVSPIKFIVTAAVAAIFWIAYLGRPYWIQRRVYRRASKPRS